MTLPSSERPEPRYLVTGAAGYVGNHAILALRERGAKVVILDNMRQGHRAAMPDDVEVVGGELSVRGLAVRRDPPLRGAAPGG